MKLTRLLTGLTLGALTLVASGSNAATTWTNWSSGTVGYYGGSASGTLGSTSVTYTGEDECLNCYASNWSPASTWTGGPVTSAPPGNSGIQLFGGGGDGGPVTDTLSFSSPVTNPVLAIVSLGQTGINASFNFNGDPTFVLLGGGPSSTWGGSGLTTTGSNVYGTEGNGLVEFIGTYSEISWTNPTYENYYTFTVGTAGVPEPASWSLMIMGVGGVGAALRTRRRKAVPA